MSTASKIISVCALLFLQTEALAGNLHQQIQEDYAAHLGDLFEWFHRNPELSMMETETAGRLAAELR